MTPDSKTDSTPSEFDLSNLDDDYKKKPSDTKKEALRIMMSGNEKDLNTTAFAASCNGDDIGIWHIWNVYVLIGLNAGERADTVTPNGGCFKI